MKTNAQDADEAKFVVGQQAVTDDDKTKRYECALTCPRRGEIGRKARDDEANRRSRQTRERSSE